MDPTSAISMEKKPFIVALSSSISSFNASIGYSTFEFPLNLSLSLSSLYFISSLSSRSLDFNFSVPLF